MATRICSECPNLLVGRKAGTKTCSDKCRSARSRRLARQQRDRGKAHALLPHQKEISEMVREETPDVAHKLIQEELRPVVREALTEDVLRAIDKMVGLTARAVDAIAEDLYAEDPVVRQRAYSLVTKYTLGHPALVRPADADPNTQLVVHFALPRPGSDPDVVEAHADELRTCDMCQLDKPASEFVANSQRCQSCWDTQRAEVATRFGVDA